MCGLQCRRYDFEIFSTNEAIGDPKGLGVTKGLDGRGACETLLVMRKFRNGETKVLKLRDYL